MTAVCSIATNTTEEDIDPDSSSSTTSLSSLGGIRSRKSKQTWDSSTFSLSSQSSIDTQCKQLWLIRHGERMDEVGTMESHQWRNSVDNKRCFDPPLTVDGFTQAKDRGKILLKELMQLQRNEDYPLCIYASPLERTLGTAYEIAKVTQLPIVVVPGLCACAAAVVRGGLIKKKVMSVDCIADDDDGANDIDECKNQSVQNVKDNSNFELFLKQYGRFGECHFLTKQQVLQKFANNGVTISFDYTHIDNFTQSVNRLAMESTRNTIVCVTHREGVRELDIRIRGCHIPYCAMAKFACNEQYNMHAKKKWNSQKRNGYQFIYFEDD